MHESRLLKFMREFLGLTEYESDATRFMRDFLAQHPEEIASQKKGRRIWWDKDATQRSEPQAERNAPKSGGAEYTFRA